MDVLTVVVAAVGLVLTGAVSGVFFAYSNSVVPALGGVRPDQAITSMSSMNRTIMNPRFLMSFVGPPIAAVVTAVLLLTLDETGAALLYFGAAAVYVLGAIVPTAVVNVPMNNALDAGPIPADEAEAKRVWSAFATRWIRWNHLRTGSSLAALVLMGIGLLVWGYAD